MGGLARICKLYGGMDVTIKGETVKWRYDYERDEPRLESEMTKEEIAASEKAKWAAIGMTIPKASGGKTDTSEPATNATTKNRPLF